MPDTDTYRALTALRGDLSTARHALAELDDMLTALRAEHDAFRQYAEAEFARLAGETEADQPAPAPPAKVARHCGLDTVDDCPAPVVWRWWPNGRPGASVRLCDEHAKDIDLSELEDLPSIETP